MFDYFLLGSGKSNNGYDCGSLQRLHLGGKHAIITMSVSGECTRSLYILGLNSYLDRSHWQAPQLEITQKGMHQQILLRQTE